MTLMSNNNYSSYKDQKLKNIGAEREERTVYLICMNQKNGISLHAVTG